ncbi:MAG: discoidin domain-containing protein [Clostridia bacterium]|nr:discoidin domain-containing protein [Clostridia bacterium]
MKKALSLVLTMCIVLSLFATFVVSASAEEAVNLAAGLDVANQENMGTDITELWIDTDLTDGVVDASEDFANGIKWTTGQWFGYWYNSESTVTPNSPNGVAIPTVDLGKACSIESARVHVYLGSDYSGIVAPKSVALLVSDDGETYTEVGKTAVTAAADTKTQGWVEVALETAVEARYVRIAMEHGGYWLFIDELEVWGTEVEETVEVKVLNLDRANHYDWTEKDYNSTQYTPTASSAGEILLAAAADANAKVGERFGGNYFTWWYVILAEWDAAAEAYVVTEIDIPGDGDGKPYENWTLGEGKLVVLCNTGYSSTEVAGNADDAAVVKEIVVGDKLTVNGSDFATLAATSGALENVSLTINAPAEEGGKVVITKGENIALNKTYTLSGCGERASYYAKLTDGVAKADLSYNNDEWFGFYCHGEDQTVINAPDKVGFAVIDLGEAKSIYSVRANLVNKDSSGISIPESVKVYLSNDGETFTEAASLATQTGEDTAYWTEANVTGEARYVKVEFKLGGTFAFLNEIEVYEAVETIVSDDDEPEVIVETITVDGDLNDTGWLEDGWTVVTKDNGTFQGGIGNLKVAASQNFTYKFQMRADETKLYVAAIYDCPIVEVDDSGRGTKFRLWIHNEDPACIAYTHFYDIYMKNGEVVLVAKENFPTAEKVNNASNIENSSIAGAMKEVNGKTYFEFSVDLAEFYGEEGFNFFFNAGHKTTEGDNIDNIQMLYPAVPVPEDAVNSNFPYSDWYEDNDAVCDVAGIQLGERVVEDGEGGGETDDDLGDAGIYAIAALAVVALIGTAVVIKKRA